MFPWGSKYLLTASFVTWCAALFYGLVTGGDFVGVVSVGYKGGVGEHYGFTILVALMLATFFMGLVVFFTRDGDAEAMAALAGVESVPQITPSTRPAYWGPLSAFGAASIMLGLAVSEAFLYLGLATFFMVLVLWTVHAWSDRATADADVNEIIRDRTLGPIEVPMIAAVGIAAVILAMSRMFLAASHTGAVVIGSIFTMLIFGGAVALSRITASRRTWTTVLAVGAVAVLGGGIIAAALGERELHSESPVHTEGEGE